MVRLFSELHQSAEIFSDDVEFDVDNASDADFAEVSMFERVRNNRHLEAVGLGVADGKRHAVDGYGAFFDGNVSFSRHFRRDVVGEREVSATVDDVDSGANGCLVDVALHDVSVEPSVEEHTSLEVDEVADFEQTEVAAVEGFLNGRNGECAITGEVDHGKTDAVVSDRLVNSQLVGKRASHCDM